MERIKEILGLVDRAHLPQPGAPKSQDFKEWYHFNVLDPAQGVDIIFNFSVAGNPGRTGAGEADVIALCHLASSGWCGSIDTYDATAARVECDRLQIELGSTEIAYSDGAYHLTCRLRDAPLAFEMRLSPRAKPMMIWNDTPVGSGGLNWLIVPDLEASGHLTISGTTKLLDRADAYHDHNWGYWKWGEDFGWDWGFSTGPRPAPEAPSMSVVFGRTASRNGDAIYEQTMAIWSNAELVKLFTRRQVRARREGRHAGEIPRVPGVARLIEQGSVLTVPARYCVSARDAPDWLDIDYRVETALQICVPTDFGFGLVGLNETFGTAEIRGEIGGRRVEFAARACFEFVG